MTEPPIRTERNVEQSWIDAYGRVNGDSEAMHYDAERARALGFRGTVAHGALLVAPLVELAMRRFGPDFLSGGALAVRWRLPVCAGDRIAASIDADGTLEVVIANLPDRPACIVGAASCIGGDRP